MNIDAYILYQKETGFRLETIERIANGETDNGDLLDYIEWLENTVVKLTNEKSTT